MLFQSPSNLWGNSVSQTDEDGRNVELRARAGVSCWTLLTSSTAVFSFYGTPASVRDGNSQFPDGSINEWDYWIGRFGDIGLHEDPYRVHDSRHVCRLAVGLDDRFDSLVKT